ETKTRTVLVDGQNKQETYAVMYPKVVQQLRQVIADNYLVMTVGGERLTKEQAAKRFAAETDVLVTTTGKLLDPAYQKLYPPETLIICLRPEPTCDAGFGGLMPPPPTPPAEPMP